MSTPIYSSEEHRQIVQRLQRIGHLDPDVDYPYPGEPDKGRPNGRNNSPPGRHHPLTLLKVMPGYRRTS